MPASSPATMAKGSLSMPSAAPTGNAAATAVVRAHRWPLRAARTAQSTAPRPITLGRVWEIVAGAQSSTWYERV